MKRKLPKKSLSLIAMGVQLRFLLVLTSQYILLWYGSETKQIDRLVN